MRSLDFIDIFDDLCHAFAKDEGSFGLIDPACAQEPSIANIQKTEEIKKARPCSLFTGSEQTLPCFENRQNIYLISKDPDWLSQILPRFQNQQVQIKALTLDSNAQRQPLVLVSAPKAGTHLLIALAERLGFQSGGELPTAPIAGYWYGLDPYSIHTSAKAWFHSRNSRGQRPYGGRFSAFDSVFGLVIYRHPRDMLRARLNYNFTPGQTIMGRYATDENRAQKCDLLLDPQSLFGDFAEELADSLNWLRFPNIIPVAYEEFCASPDKSDACADVIWALQLILQAAGCPEEIHADCFGQSETFRDGKVFLPDPDIDARSQDIAKLSADYCARLGYSANQGWPENFSDHRARPFSTQDSRPRNKRIRFLNTGQFSLFYYNQRYYARRKGVPDQFMNLDGGFWPRLLLGAPEAEQLVAQVRQLESGQAGFFSLAFLPAVFLFLTGFSLVRHLLTRCLRHFYR